MHLLQQREVEMIEDCRNAARNFPKPNTTGARIIAVQMDSLCKLFVVGIGVKGNIFARRFRPIPVAASAFPVSTLLCASYSILFPLRTVCTREPCRVDSS